MRVDYQPLTITGATATSEAPDFPASNLLTARIDNPWRSAGGGAQTVTVTLAGPAAVAAVWLYGCNVESATVAAGDVSGLLLLSKDEDTELRRGRFNIGGMLISEIQITLENAPSSGYFEIGAIHAFGKERHIGSIGERPQFPLNYPMVYPQVTRKLLNGKTSVARTGTPYRQISGKFHHENGSGVGELIELARANGSISFDLELPARPDLAWIVTFNADGYDAAVIYPHTSGAGLDESTFIFDEIV